MTWRQRLHRLLGRYGPGTGGFDPEERMNYERRLFFGTDQSLVEHTIRVHRECSDGDSHYFKLDKPFEPRKRVLAQLVGAGALTAGLRASTMRREASGH